MSRRRDARERVLQALYAGELSESDVDHLLDTIIRPKLADDAQAYRFAVGLLARTVEQAAETSALIKKHTKNWDLRRIAVIDRLVLQMAITEILYFGDIPPKVSINEAIEIAKDFSTARSGQFVNGILDAVLEDLKQEGRLQKTGRGLIGLDEDGPEPTFAAPDKPGPSDRPLS